jgi:hypothetical protein
MGKNKYDYAISITCRIQKMFESILPNKEMSKADWDNLQNIEHEFNKFTLPNLTNMFDFIRRIYDAWKTQIELIEITIKERNDCEEKIEELEQEKDDYKKKVEELKNSNALQTIHCVNERVLEELKQIKTIDILNYKTGIDKLLQYLPAIGFLLEEAWNDGYLTECKRLITLSETINMIIVKIMKDQLYDHLTY